MPYQVLARKYRPQRFSDVVGQDHVTRTLLNALAQSRIAHGYIFSGHRGIGKTTIARILAMALNCRTEIGSPGGEKSPRRPTSEPCGTCDSCTEVRAGNAVDVIEIDAATNRGIDEIRELRDAARYRPARDRYKIYILDEAHQITDAAFNALLKTLEEPPDHVVFMMATTQPEDIPQTIRSRCQHFSFHAVKFEDILLQLRTIATEEQVGADDDALALLAEAGDGSMRDALSIMDQAIASAPLVDGAAHLDAAQIRELMGSVPNTVFERLLEAIGENQSAPVIEEVNRLLNAGNSASQLARQFVRYLRNVLMARLAGEQTELLQLSPDERARAARSALLFSEEDLTRFLQVMLRTFDELNYRQEPRFHLELGLLKLVHLQRLLPVEQLLSQLEAAAPGKPPTLGGGPLPGPSRTSASSAPASRPAVPTTTASGQTASIAKVAGKDAAQPPISASPQLPEQSVQRSPEPSPQQPAPATPAAFSPFEADSRRKGADQAAPRATRNMPPPATAGPTAPAAIESEDPASPPAGELAPAAAATRPEPYRKPPPPHAAAEPPATLAAAAPQPSATISEGVSESPSAATSEPQSSAAGEALPPALFLADKAAGAPHLDALDTLRAAVVAALDAAGHNTAAALIASAAWVDTGDAVRVEVAAKKTMLGLTMNAEAEKICREAARSVAGEGSRGKPLSFVSGESAAARQRPGPAPLQPGPSGSAQARALENPLVRQAQELFRAEVRSVVDLRNK